MLTFLKFKFAIVSIFAMHTGYSFQTFENKNDTVKITINEGQEKMIRKVIKKNKSARVLSIQFPWLGEWKGYGHIGDEIWLAGDDERTLKKLPKQIGKLKQLEKLNVSELNLETLPKEISKLTKLKSLDISFNNIDINQEVDKLIPLKNLHELRIFGLHPTEETLALLREKIPGVRIKRTNREFGEALPEIK